MLLNSLNVYIAPPLFPPQPCIGMHTFFYAHDAVLLTLVGYLQLTLLNVQNMRNLNIMTTVMPYLSENKSHAACL